MSARGHKKGVDINDIGYIYIISLDIKGKKYVKIGKTIDPTKRLLTYNSHVPIPMFSYFFVSSKMYNISNIENNIIHIMNKSKSMTTVGKKLEWFAPRRRGTIRAGSIDKYMESIVREIEKYEESYYEE